MIKEVRIFINFLIISLICALFSSCDVYKNETPFVYAKLAFINKFDLALNKININGTDLTFSISATPPICYVTRNSKSSCSDNYQKDCVFFSIKPVDFTEKSKTIKNINELLNLNDSNKKITSNYQVKTLYVILKDSKLIEVPIITNNESLYTANCISKKELESLKSIYLSIFDKNKQQEILLHAPIEVGYL